MDSIFGPIHSLTSLHTARAAFTHSALPLTLQLSMSLAMPLTGFGLWKVPAAEASDVVYNALKTGYRLLDGAADYGNEAECGEGLARAIKDGIVTREEVYITSKVWNTFRTKEQVHEAVRLQLKHWKIASFDLYLIHFPVSLEYVSPETRYPPEWWNGTPGGPVTLAQVPVSETWAAMEEIKEQGLAHNIGVSNFCGGLLIDLFRHVKKHKPTVLQIEHHRMSFIIQPSLAQITNSALTHSLSHSTRHDRSRPTARHACHSLQYLRSSILPRTVPR